MLPIRVEWAIAAQAQAIMIFDGRWSWRDIDTAIASLVHMAETVNHPIDLIVDARKSTLWEPDLLEHARTNFVPPKLTNHRLTLIVGADEFTRVLIETLPTLPGLGYLKFHFFDTPEEAIAFSEQYTSE